MAVMSAVLALAMLPGGPAYAPPTDWRVAMVDKDEAGPSVVFVDAASITRQDSETRFTVQIRYRQAASGFDALVFRAAATCSDYRWQMLETTSYLRGEMVDTAGETEWLETQPHSIGHNVLDAVCEGGFRSGPVEPATHAIALLGGD